MKAYVSIYIDLDPLNLTEEEMGLFNNYLAKVKDDLYEDLRNRLAVGPANFGRQTKAEHGIKDGRDTVEIKPPKVKKPRKPKPTPPDATIPPGELGDDPPLEAPGT